MSTYKIGNRQFEAESRYLTLNMRDSSGLMDDVDALRQRMAEDGFLLIRNFHDRNEVMGVRHGILTKLAEQNKLHPEHPLMEGVIHPNPAQQETPTVRGRDHLKSDALRRLVYGRRTMTFFERFLGGEPMSYNFQWLRAVGTNSGSTASTSSSRKATSRSRAPFISGGAIQSASEMTARLWTIAEIAQPGTAHCEPTGGNSRSGPG